MTCRSTARIGKGAAALGGWAFADANSVRKIMKLLKLFFAAATVSLLPVRAFAQTSTTWVPLITADMFTGVRTDIGTAITGILFLILIIAGAGLLYRVLSH